MLRERIYARALYIVPALTHTADPLHVVRQGRLALETFICLPSAQGINTKAVSVALSHPSVPPTSSQTVRPISKLALPSASRSRAVADPEWLGS